MIPDYWRDSAHVLKGFAGRCKKCGYLNYPHRRICVRCAEGTEFEFTPLPREGVIYSYIINHYAPAEMERPAICALVDLGERRLYGQITECSPADVHVGMPVERVIRIIREHDGLVFYGIKFRPRRKGR